MQEVHGSVSGTAINNSYAEQRSKAARGCVDWKILTVPDAPENYLPQFITHFSSSVAIAINKQNPTEMTLIGEL
jgi:hypothetical protein